MGYKAYHLHNPITHSNEFGLLRAYPKGLTNGEGLNANWLQIMDGISSDADSHH